MLVNVYEGLASGRWDWALEEGSDEALFFFLMNALIGTLVFYKEALNLRVSSVSLRFYAEKCTTQLSQKYKDSLYNYEDAE